MQVFVNLHFKFSPNFLKLPFECFRSVSEQAVELEQAIVILSTKHVVGKSVAGHNTNSRREIIRVNRLVDNTGNVRAEDNASVIEACALEREENFTVVVSAEFVNSVLVTEDLHNTVKGTHFRSNGRTVDSGEQ